MEVDPLHRILLGAMTLILLIASLLFIGQELTALPPGQDYFIYFKESVTGLSKNSKVTYEGREVGKVKAIEEEVRENGIYSKVTLVLNSTVYQQQLRVEEVLGAPLGRTWFRPGDEILSVDGNPVLTYDGVRQAVICGQAITKDVPDRSYEPSMDLSRQ